MGYNFFLARKMSMLLLTLNILFQDFERRARPESEREKRFRMRMEPGASEPASIVIPDDDDSE